MDRDEIRIMLWVVIGAVLFIFILFLMGTLYSMSMDRSYCVAKVDGQVWYQGPAYALECASQGDATQCTERNSQNVFTMMSAKRHVISRNIQVECK